MAGYYDGVLQTRQHIEEGYGQAEHGELIGGEHVQREIQAMKTTWRQEHAHPQ